MDPRAFLDLTAILIGIASLFAVVALVLIEHKEGKERRADEYL